MREKDSRTPVAAPSRLLLPVIDLLGGQVVRGVAGRRNEYRPVESLLTSDASPASIARAFAERIGFTEAYVADLDAIAGRPPAWHDYEAIAAAGLRLWVDAGIADAASAHALAQATVAGRPLHRIGVGLESVASVAALHEIVAGVGIERSVFSLDLKNGHPLTASSDFAEAAPIDIAAVACECGVRTMIVLDLADVGTGGGTRTAALVGQMKSKWPDLQLIGGGGVRGPRDIAELAHGGLSHILVASALHDGRLTAQELRR